MNNSDEQYEAVINKLCELLNKDNSLYNVNFFPCFALIIKSHVQCDKRKWRTFKYFFLSIESKNK